MKVEGSDDFSFLFKLGDFVLVPAVKFQLPSIQYPRGMVRPGGGYGCFPKTVGFPLKSSHFR